jgi:hypothetical protein
MKKFILAMIIVSSLLTFGASSQAYAATFIDTITWGTSSGVTISNAANTPASTGFSPVWQHNITDNIGGNLISNVTLSTVSLAVTFSNTNGNENWHLADLGDLANKNNPFTSNFSFGVTPLTDLQADGLYTVVVTETGNPTTADSFTLFSATLTGNYEVKATNDDGDDDEDGTTIPEPATMALMSIGLAGLGLVRRRFKA